MKKIFLTLLAFLLISTSAQAITITVDMATDEYEADYVADCTSGTDCSLAEAIRLANSTPDEDTIEIPAILGPIVLRDLMHQIQTSMTIMGTGTTGKTILDGSQVSNYPFHINMSSFSEGVEKNVTFKNLEFINFANTPQSGGPSVIYYSGYLDGILKLENTRFVGNTGGEYGVVHLQGISSLTDNLGNQMSIISSEFINNTNTTKRGGALTISIGNVYIQDSLFDGNSSGSDGGAIALFKGGLLSFNNTFINNRAGLVAGVHTGGAVYLNLSDGAFIQTKFINNNAKSYGGALAAVQEDVCSGSLCPFPIHAKINIQQSLFSTNNAVLGAGIYLRDATTTDDHTLQASLINSNVISNFGRQQFVPSAMPGQGAGLYIDNVDTRISYSTIAQNRSAHAGLIIPGSGMQVLGNKEISIKASIIAENTAFNATETVTSDCKIESTNKNSEGFNVLGNTCDNLNTQTTNPDSIGVSPGFDTPLEENGFVVALPLTTNSPAVDFSERPAKHCEAINDFTTGSPVSVPNDYLGNTRPLGTFCDAGAFELNCSTLAAYYVDADGDSYGSGSPVTLCSPRAGYVVRDGDCNDSDAFAYTTYAQESCEGHDNNCNGEIDEGFTDTDNDQVADCVDTETCDGLDNNGNGEYDEGFADTDGDGKPDCTDIETCDGIDNDGDGLTDEGFADTDIDQVADCVDTETCDGLDNNGNGEYDEGFADTDGDGKPDCTDIETCDGIDNDGDGLTDEGFADTDIDQVADCVDECDADNSKIAAGTCGCGMEETDIDSDGVVDCGDLCLTDPDKNAPGACGCNKPDTDSDGDGVAYCVDACEGDPAKSVPGICGCGKLDTDSDSDGSADCVDECDGDALKTSAGICGCGMSETDINSDGVVDCGDLCPTDPAKNAPGICGCGILDIDSDSDGTADCVDECDTDNSKIAAGTCGCGLSDADADGDGAADCQDLCIDDPAKSSPGACGCGTNDTDSDNDGALDCVDECDSDLNKTVPGTCGCGVSETITDTDGDGRVDCVDTEECDEFDNNGNGQINEGLDCPVTPDPITPDPVTPDPVTPAPVTPAPVTPTEEEPAVTPVDETDPSDTTIDANKSSGGGGCSLSADHSNPSGGLLFMLLSMGLVVMRKRSMAE